MGEGRRARKRLARRNQRWRHCDGRGRGVGAARCRAWGLPQPPQLLVCTSHRVGGKSPPARGGPVARAIGPPPIGRRVSHSPTGRGNPRRRRHSTRRRVACTRRQRRALPHFSGRPPCGCRRCARLARGLFPPRLLLGSGHRRIRPGRCRWAVAGLVATVRRLSVGGIHCGRPLPERKDVAQQLDGRCQRASAALDALKGDVGVCPPYQPRREGARALEVGNHERAVGASVAAAEAPPEEVRHSGIQRHLNTQAHGRALSRGWVMASHPESRKEGGSG